MKRFFTLYISILVILLVLANTTGCRRAKPQAKEEGKITVTSLIFPTYDFVRVIAGDRVNLTLLLPPGSESHSFEPSPSDIITIRSSDLFIYPGGENNKWVERILSSTKNSSDMKILNLLELVDALEETLVEGMEGEQHDADHEEGEEEEVELDDHVWTSPVNAKLIVIAITEALCELDSDNADFFRQNAENYCIKLDELDAAFRSVVESAKRKTIVVGDRFPFAYLANTYDLEYYAAFPGCSTDTEPSAKTVAFLINKVKKEQIPVIFHIELSNERMANTISEATKAKKLLLHSTHNLTKKDFESGMNYLDIQQNNVVNLKEALW